MQVCNLSTPAQYFHVLRRQVRRDFRKPLVLMTPKSLLRNERAVSYIDDFTTSKFEPVLGPTLISQPDEVKRVIFCCGKVYYDLLKYQETNQIKEAALVRVEQLYPLNLEAIQKTLNGFSSLTKCVWCQEEPRNMGAWTYVAPLLENGLGREIHYAGRPAAASPAVGAKALHDQHQKDLVHQAYSL
jgi:2-oxoglutarate dehydrogenase complex dehydrogenase (E1) component-like enzyme